MTATLPAGVAPASVSSAGGQRRIAIGNPVSQEFQAALEASASSGGAVVLGASAGGAPSDPSDIPPEGIFVPGDQGLVPGNGLDAVAIIAITNPGAQTVPLLAPPDQPFAVAPEGEGVSLEAGHLLLQALTAASESASVKESVGSVLLEVSAVPRAPDGTLSSADLPGELTDDVAVQAEAGFASGVGLDAPSVSVALSQDAASPNSAFPSVSQNGRNALARLGSRAAQEALAAMSFNDQPPNLPEMGQGAVPQVSASALPRELQGQVAPLQADAKMVSSPLAKTALAASSADPVLNQVQPVADASGDLSQEGGSGSRGAPHQGVLMKDGVKLAPNIETSLDSAQALVSTSATQSSVITQVSSVRFNFGDPRFDLQTEDRVGLQHLQMSPAKAAELASEQIAPRIFRALSSGRDSLTVELRPVELGRVEVKVMMVGDRLAVELTVDRPETYDAFRQNRGVLEQQLSQAGVTVSGGGIDLRLGRRDGRGDQDRSRGEPKVGSVAADMTAPGAGSDLEVRPAVRSGVSLLDIVA